MKPMEDAPQDGTVIKLFTVDGVNGEPFFEGLASWRSEPRGALFDPLTGEQFARAENSTGWMRADSTYRVPGRPVGWLEAEQ